MYMLHAKQLLSLFSIFSAEVLLTKALKIPRKSASFQKGVALSVTLPGPTENNCPIGCAESRHGKLH